MRLSFKLTISFLIVALIAGMLSYVNLKVAENAINEFENIVEAKVPTVIALTNLKDYEHEIMISMQTYFYMRNESELKTFESTKEKIDQKLTEYSNLVKESGGETDGNEIIGNISDVNQKIIGIVASLRSQVIPDYTVTEDFREYYASFDKMKYLVSREIDLTQIELKDSEAKTKQMLINLDNTILLSYVFIILVSIFVGYIVSVDISKSVHILYTGAKKIGSGDLDFRVHVKSHDEIERLANEFNQMAKDLKVSRTKLENYSKTLEVKVRQRTGQLNKKMKETLKLLDEVEKTKSKLQKTYKELKSLDKMKVNFMNIAAHELKTPLIPIIGYLDMLLKGEFGKLNAEEKENLEIVLKNAKRLQKLIQDVLDITKLESKVIKFDMKNIQVAEIVKSSIRNMKPFADEKKLALKARIPSKLPLIYGDTMRLTQVLSNLIDNAIKFTDKGDVSVEVERKSNNIIVNVSDTGVGVDKKFIPKLFKKFQQADTSAKRKYGGTGLGLVICKEIIEGHKGKIWLEDASKNGSIFSLSLPIKRRMKK